MFVLNAAIAPIHQRLHAIQLYVSDRAACRFATQLSVRVAFRRKRIAFQSSLPLQFNEFSKSPILKGGYHTPAFPIDKAVIYILTQ